MREQRDIYQDVTNRIIDGLKKGVVPWKSGLTSATAPTNFVTQSHYQGINFLLLLIDQLFNKRISPYYATYKQIQALGGSVKRGSRGIEIVYYSKIIRHDDTGEKITPYEYSLLSERAQENYTELAFLKTYYVFNVGQTEGISASQILGLPSVINNKSEVCENIIKGYEDAPTIELVNYQPCYIPSRDVIKCPSIESFEHSDYYYATLFHELVHSTGHAKRLNRDGITISGKFGNEIYAFEELIAEIGATFLCAKAEILNNQIENSVSYIDGWLEALKKDKRYIFKASAQAQKAVDYIHSNELVLN